MFLHDNFDISFSKDKPEAAVITTQHRVTIWNFDLIKFFVAIEVKLIWLKYCVQTPISQKKKKKGYGPGLGVGSTSG